MSNKALEQARQLMPEHVGDTWTHWEPLLKLGHELAQAAAPFGVGPDHIRIPCESTTNAIAVLLTRVKRLLWEQTGPGQTCYIRCFFFRKRGHFPVPSPGIFPAYDTLGEALKIPKPEQSFGPVKEFTSALEAILHRIDVELTTLGERCPDPRDVPRHTPLSVMRNTYVANALWWLGLDQKVLDRRAQETAAVLSAA